MNGTRVVVGQYEQFLKTTCITDLSFLNSIDDGNPDLLQPEVQKYLAQQLGRPVSALLSLLKDVHLDKKLLGKRRISIRGTIKRSRSKSDVQVSGILLSRFYPHFTKFRVNCFHEFFLCRHGCRKIEKTFKTPFRS